MIQMSTRCVAVALCAAICLVALAAAPASALFTCDFETGLGQNGQPIGGPLDGLIFSTSLGGDVYFADINSGWYSVTSDNGKVFEDGEYYVRGNVAAYVMNLEDTARATFAPGLAIYFQLGYSSQFEFFLKAYDSSGGLLASTTGAANSKSNGGTGLSYLSIEQDGMAYVEFGSEGAGGYWMVDDIAWVPEPTAWIALAVGLVGLVGWRKRK